MADEEKNVEQAEAQQPVDQTIDAPQAEESAAQQPEAYYTSRAVVVLQNDGDLESLRGRADALAVQIREWANGR